MKTRKRSQPSDQVYQLKITLKWTKPPIWRRVLVPGDITLDRLHRVIQIVMDWEDAHLHEFRVGETSYGMPNPDYWGWADVQDERRFRLDQIAPAEKDRFVYEYDFGDSWEHLIQVEKIVPRDPDRAYPACTAGRRAAPGGHWWHPGLLQLCRGHAESGGSRVPGLPGLVGRRTLRPGRVRRGTDRRGTATAAVAAAVTAHKRRRGAVRIRKRVSKVIKDDLPPNSTQSLMTALTLYQSLPARIDAAHLRV